ncbi:MAG: alpha/beta fold hydrolase [Minicystis sp.]
MPSRRRVALALGVIAALATGCEMAFEHVGAGALVYAPNAGRPPAADADPLPAGLAGRALRVEVGPPRAALAVWVLDPAGAPRGTVFVLHGIRDRKRSLVGWGQHLTALGYRAALVDHRGQGASSGDFMTYGVVESRDLGQVADTLAREGLLAGRLGVMGTSYGAATAIEWAGADPRVAAVIAVAPFASLRAVVPRYVELLLPGVGGLVPGAVVTRAITRGGRTAGFDPDGASPLDAIGKTRAPVLLVHGKDDQHILPWHSESLHARAPDHSELLLVDGEDHISINADRHGVLWAHAEPWLARALGTAASPLPPEAP